MRSHLLTQAIYFKPPSGGVYGLPACGAMWEGGLMQSLFGDKDFANDLNRNILEFTMLPFNRLPQ